MMYFAEGNPKVPWFRVVDSFGRVELDFLTSPRAAQDIAFQMTLKASETARLLATQGSILVSGDEATSLFAGCRINSIRGSISLKGARR